MIERFPLNCAVDDTYTFYANSERTFEALTENPKCSSTEPSLIEDVWSFTNASGNTLYGITFLFSDLTSPLIVRAADDDEMELEIFLDEENTASYRIHFGF
ncbi:MAG: hypothetical protein U5K54_10790 [Cytophagales bacterium]|nr:hypothetical protein [Cytophagales bacterium]